MTVLPESDDMATASAVLTNAVGLHARPSVKLTQLAKSFGCRVEIALDAAGPWVDAKSPVKVMRVKAPQGATVHVRATGAGAGAAAGALIALVTSGFEDGSGAAGPVLPGPGAAGPGKTGHGHG